MSEQTEVSAVAVERARLAGAAWFASHPDGASSEDEWRDHYRSVLEAAANDAPTDYRCLNSHVFSVPWGDEFPRSTVVCPKCGATSFIHSEGVLPGGQR